MMTVSYTHLDVYKRQGQLPPHAEDLLARLADAGMDPIIAHAERNPTLAQKVDQLEKWCERGVLVQITAKSLEGGFGAKAADAAWRIDVYKRQPLHRSRWLPDGAR